MIEGPVDGDGARPARRPSSWTGMVPFGIALLVILAYLPGSGRSLDFDSSQTVGSYVRTPSLLDPLRSQRLFNNHPAFSFVEHLIYTLTGSAEEWVLRLAPITFAGLAVGVLVAALRRPFGTWPAACAGLVMGTNPTVIELSRAVRGYSLLLLCGVLSSWALARLLSADDRPTSSTAWSAVYVAAVAIGTATHLYMLPIVLGHMAVVAARRSMDRSWGLRWLAGVGLGASIYASMASDLVDAAQTGSRTFKPRFPLLLAEVVLGSGLGAALVAVVVVVGAAIVLGQRPDVRVATLVVGSAVAVTWLVTASVHLEARFHVWLVPAAAVLVAAAVRRYPWLALAVVAGAMVNAWSEADGYVADPNAAPELAALLDHAAAQGDRGCVTNFSVLPILGYTSQFAVVLEPSDLRACDVVAVPFPHIDGELEAAARAVLPAEARYEADYEDGLAFARDPSYFDRLCTDLGGESDLCPP